MLQVLTAAVAFIALIRIARDRRRRGATLALLALFVAPYSFWLVDLAFLAPHHIGAPKDDPGLRLASAVNGAWYYEILCEPNVRVTVDAGRHGEIRFALEGSVRGHIPLHHAGPSDDALLLDGLSEVIGRVPEHSRYTF